MKGFILGLSLGLVGVASAQFFSYNSVKTSINGTTCIIVTNGTGMGVSCDWGKK